MELSQPSIDAGLAGICDTAVAVGATDKVSIPTFLGALQILVARLFPEVTGNRWWPESKFGLPLVFPRDSQNLGVVMWWCRYLE